MTWWLLILLLPTAVIAHCPGFFRNQTACSCFDNVDGSVIRCSGQEGPLMVERMKKTPLDIRELSLENANIVEIGPRAFKNLRIRKLVLDKNRIKAIHKDALRGLENVLQELSLAQNKLTMVPSAAIAGMKSLLVLNLKCNKIGNLTKPVFANVTSLIDINLSCNEICEMSADTFSGVRNSLQNLILDMNCLMTFPSKAVENLDSLIALHLKGNKISSIDEGQLTNLSSLAMLSLSDNNISFIHPAALRNTPNLSYVYLAGNNIRSFDTGTMAQFKHTQVLDLAFNRLKEIREETFGGLESLQNLNLDGNRIKTISPGAFSGIPLLLLWLPNNCLSSITPSTFQGAMFLRQLSLANNDIQEIQPLSFNHLANLHTLDLASNRIQSLQQGAIQGSDHLTVRLQENPLVCLQDGFHVMNGQQAINLTTEANKVCQTNWREQNSSICPKAITRPVTSTCCDKKMPMHTPVVTTTTTTTTTITTTTTTSTEPDHAVAASEHQKEGRIMEDSDERAEATKMRSTGKGRAMGEEELVHRTFFEQDRASAFKHKKKVNMDRFWRLSRHPYAGSSSAVLRSRYMAKTTEATKERAQSDSDEDVRGKLEGNEQEDEEEEAIEDDTSEEELLATTEKPLRRPLRTRGRGRTSANLPPWLRISNKRKHMEPNEEFSEDDDVKVINVQREVQH